MIFIIQEELQRELLSGPPSWSRQSTKGLTLRQVTLDDFGSYVCSGKMRNTTDKEAKERFKMIVSGKGLSIEFLDLSDDCPFLFTNDRTRSQTKQQSS